MSLENVLVLFDWDGTAIKGLPMGHWGTCQLFTQYGLAHPTIEAYALNDGFPFKDIVASLIPDTHAHLRDIIPDKALALLEREARNPDTEMPPLEIYAGMPDAIAALVGQGARCGITTNRQGELLHEYDFRVAPEIKREWFSVIMTGDRMLKPDPRAIWMSAEEAGFTDGVIIMVGDTPTDIQTAKAAGAGSVGVAWDAGSNLQKFQRLKESAPSSIVYDPENLVAIIEDLATTLEPQNWQNRYDATGITAGRAGTEHGRGPRGGGGRPPGRYYQCVP